MSEGHLHRALFVSSGVFTVFGVTGLRRERTTALFRDFDQMLGEGGPEPDPLKAAR
jgi:hypothetical protein